MRVRGLRAWRAESREAGLGLGGLMCTALLALVCAWASDAEGRSASREMLSCGRQLATGLHGYTVETLGVLVECEADAVKDGEFVDCPADESVLDDLRSRSEKIERRAKKCRELPLKAFCPFGVRDYEQVSEALGSGEESLTAAILDLNHGLFVEDYGGSCPRPVGEVSRDTESCVDSMARAVEETLDEVLKCVIKCEVSNLVPGRNQGRCLEAGTGEPLREKIESCYERTTLALVDDLERRCDVGTLRELGCPMGVSDVYSLSLDIMDRVQAVATRALEGTYRSSCRRPLDFSEPEAAKPARVTLTPSGRQAEIRCGDTLDGEFFLSDDVMFFDTDLDCRPIQAVVDGVTIAHSGVTISGRSKYRIRGPGKSRYQTGTGIRLAPGATDITIKSFRTVERFGTGIGDSGDNIGVVVRDLSVRRNREVGIRMESYGVVVDDVRADRNVIGIWLSGDGSTIRDSRAQRSEPAPGIGILVDSVELAGDSAIRVTSTKIFENMVGVVLERGDHHLEESEIRDNTGAGVIVRASHAKIESNSVKRNGGTGVEVLGSFNRVMANRSDENGGDGYRIEGIANEFDGNGAGSLSDQGNQGAGFRVLGVYNQLDSNRAEANLDSGYVVEGLVTLLENNHSTENHAVGFEVLSSSSALDSNVADGNLGDEFSVVAGVNDVRGNRANGRTVELPAGGGTVE